MVRQPGFFDVEERLRELSAKGDDLERIAALVDFAMFRAELEQAVPRADGTKGGRPAFDHVLMFKILLLQAMHGLSDERCEYLIKDRLSFMRFLGLGLADPVPDANTIWAFREALKRAGAVERLFALFDATLRDAGYLAMGGQIVDATIIAAPKQRNTEAERAAIKAGQIPEGWAEKPAKLRQKDRDARWTVKFSKARPREDGAPQVDLAVPAFGYKNHVAIDRRHWWFSPVHTTGLVLPGGLPVEEVVFFLVIPICGLLTYEAVGVVLGRRRRVGTSAARETAAVDARA